MNKKQEQAQNIRKHGEDLKKIYPECKEADPVKLCKRLHRLEFKAHQLAIRLCNGPEFAPGKYEEETESVLARVRAILEQGPSIFMNGDPRGYALKIEDEESRSLEIHKDWGGFGIICPEF